MAEIVITEFMDEDVARELASRRDVLYDPTLVDDPARLARAAQNCRALIVRNRTKVGGALLDQCPELRVIGRLGVGLERIDLEACRARNIRVFPARGANAGAVAEYVIVGLLILFRGAFFATQAVIDGDWPRQRLVGREIAGRALGLVGFGDIARHVARRATALGMSVNGCDPYVGAEDPAWREHRVSPLSFDTLVAESDALSLHVPLTPETHHLIDAEVLRRMRADAVLINTTRGGVVDEEALAAALRDGRIAGAMLDVFEEEPLSAERGLRFRGVPNLVLTPHIAGVTLESNRCLSVMTVNHVLKALDETLPTEPRAIPARRPEQARGTEQG